jgi:hypothetical protein
LIIHARTALDSQDRTVSTGFPGEDTWDRACRTKQRGEDNKIMIYWAGKLEMTIGVIR